MCVQYTVRRKPRTYRTVSRSDKVNSLPAQNHSVIAKEGVCLFGSAPHAFGSRPKNSPRITSSTDFIVL